MKLNKLILLLFLSITVISCDDDDDDREVSLIGSWKLTSFTTETNHDLNNDGTATDNLIVETNCMENERLVFSENGVGFNNFTSSFDIELELISGSTDTYQYIVDCIQEVDADTFAWTENGNTITIDYGGSDTIAFTKSNNELKIVVMDGFEIENDITNEGVIEDTTLIFTKE